MEEKDIVALTKAYEKRLQLFSDKNKGKALNLYDLETEIGKEFRELQSDMLEKASNHMNQESKKKTCNECGKNLICREFRSREILTTFGKINERRRYYHCSGCKKNGFFIDNPERAAGRLSGKLTEIVCLLAQNSTFGVARDLIHRICGILVCTSTVKEVAECIGGDLYRLEESESETCTQDIHTLNFDPKIMENRAYLQIDGSMIHHLTEWKENKLGLAFSEADLKVSGDGENARISIKKKILFSSFAQGVEPFKKRLKLWLVKSGLMYAREVIAITDGAQWIENIIKEMFLGGTHILDWFHVKEKTWSTAKKIFGEGSPKAQEWVTNICDDLWQGKLEIALQKIWTLAFLTNGIISGRLRDLTNFTHTQRILI